MGLEFNVQMQNRKQNTDDTECKVEQCANQIRKDRDLAPTAPVATFVVCNCPKCRPTL